MRLERVDEPTVGSDGAKRALSRWRLVALAFALAVFAIRAPAAWYAYPFEGNPDERCIVATAHGIARSGDLDPHVFNYPSLEMYLVAGAFEILSRVPAWRGAFGLADVLPTPQEFVVARLMILALACATIYATGRLALRWFDPLAALAAMCFVAASPLHTALSYTATVDPAAALFAVLTCAIALRIYAGEPRLRDYVLAGVLAGATAGSKYTGVLVALAVIAAHFLRRESRARTEYQRTKCLLAYLVVAPVSFFLTTPYALLDPDAFWTAIRALRDNYRAGQVDHEAAGAVTYVEYLRALMFDGFGIWPAILAAIGAVALWLEDRRKLFVLAIFPLALYALLGAYKIFFLRNALPIVPFLALFAGRGLVAAASFARSRLERRWTVERSRRLAWIGGAVVAALAFAPPLQASLRRLELARMRDVRAPALEWVLANLPAGAKIAREHRTPPIEAFTRRFEVEQIGSVVQPRRDRRLEQFDYVVVSLANYAVTQATNATQARVAYDEFFATHALLAEFAADGTTSTGATIRVYRGER
jgi:hypothetical protein